MVHGKIAGITLGGLAGYLLISKGFRLVRDTVAYAADASKWKAYYKYGVKADSERGCVVPPGYASCTRDIGGGKELVVEDPKQKKSEDGKNQDASASDLKAVISSAIKEGVDAWVNGRKGAEDASEGEEKASEEEVITEYDENGKPVAGRYPFEKVSCDDTVVYPPQFDTAPGDPEVTDVDSLENGADILEESIKTAREAGVPEENILHNAKEIDAFFGAEKENENETVD